MQIEGAVGLVTGGASGLGAAAVRMLAAAGARGVVIVDWNEAAGKTLADELGPIAASVKADVSDPSQMQASVNVAAARLVALPILATCAGLGDGPRILGKDG